LTNLGVSGTVNGAAGTVASYGYTLDAAGHRTAVAELSGRTVSYGYDSIYRLTNETIASDPNNVNGAASYTYDAVGNRRQKVSTIPGYPGGLTNYNANDQISTDTYDNDGNTTGSNGVGYVYDFENHLIQAGGGISYVYDGDGDRRSKTVGGVTTTYVVADDNPTGYAQVLEEDDSSGAARQYSYALDLISRWDTSTGKSIYYVKDGHGSVRALTDQNGAVTDTYDYDAFGNLIHSTGTTPNNYLFAGEQFDPDLNLYYNRARYLNTSTGRFWNMDTYEGDDNDPLSLHKYVFTEGDPIDNLDTNGNEIDEELAGFAVSAVISSMPTLQIGSIVGSSDELKPIGQLIADKARSYEGSRRWWQKPIPSAHTLITWDETCNIFVYDVLKEVGAEPPKLFRPGTVRAKLYKELFIELYQTPPVASEWADPGFFIPNWEIVSGGSDAAQPGDVIAEPHQGGGGHSGIVVGQHQTASASAVGLNFGKIVINDWGFRADNYNGTGRRGNAVVRRFVQPMALGGPRG